MKKAHDLLRRRTGVAQDLRGAGAAETRQNDPEQPLTFVIAHLETRMSEELVSYLHEIDATLEPFDGQYIIHGGKATELEESWSGDLIVLGFPDRDRAVGWYESPAYQKIRPLRTRNATGPLIIMDGVPRGHRGIDVLQKRSSAPAPPD